MKFSYRGYARDIIIIIPGNYAGKPTEWQKATLLALTGYKSKTEKFYLIALNKVKLTLPLNLPLECHSICRSLYACAYPLYQGFPNFSGCDPKKNHI